MPPSFRGLRIGSTGRGAVEVSERTGETTSAREMSAKSYLPANASKTTLPMSPAIACVSRPHRLLREACVLRTRRECGDPIH